jgi:hypothetical protein
MIRIIFKREWARRTGHAHEIVLGTRKKRKTERGLTRDTTAVAAKVSSIENKYDIFYLLLRKRKASSNPDPLKKTKTT